MGLSGISVSGQSITVAAKSVVIDSGTSAILMGPDDCAAIHKVLRQIVTLRDLDYCE